MAITVQGACFYLLNYTSSKKHSGSWKRNLLLAILITVSTLTSYMGIFDSVVKPVNQMSAQYNNYAKIVNNLIDDEIEMNYSYDISYRDIEKIFNQFETTIADADAVIDILNNANNQTKTTQTVPISWVDENNIVRYGTKTIPLEEASNAIVENKTQVSILTNYKTKISDYLSKEFSADDILMSINSILNNPEKLNNSTDNDKEIYNQFVSTIDVLNQLNGKLTGENNSQIVVFNMEIDKAIENAQKRNELYELYLVEYDILISEKGVTDSLEFADNQSKFLSTVFGFFEKLNKFVVSEELTEAEKIREILVKTSEKSYADLYPLLSQHNKEELDKYNSYTIYENTQIMPFTVPFKQENGLFGEALFSFAVAFLVDALSILISWALIVKTKSILYYNNVRDVRKNREEMIEDCLMYICLATMPKQLTKPDEIQRYVVEIVNNTMGKLLDKIHYIYVPDELNSFAYLSFADISQDDRHEKLLFQTLNNAALLHPFHKSELSIIIEKEFGSTSDNETSNINVLLNKYGTLFEDDEIYYLVSKNLHFWFCENFSELLQNSQTFIEVPTERKENE